MRLALALLVALSILVPAGGSSSSPPTPVAPEAWSDPATWGGELPGAGELVTVPAGKRVLLDVSPPALAGLTVDGELIFDRRDLTLTTEWIVVTGLLQVGTPEFPFTDRATITLTDTEPNEDVMGMGDRVLGQMGGRVDLHGAPTAARWTRLAANAEAGDDLITVERPVDWRPGDRIVLASTDFDAEQAEEATIVEVDGATVRLEEPLTYLHWGEDQVYGDRVVSERAEVGLLSSNVVVQADASAEITMRGGHVMSMAGQLRMSNVELTRMGQAGELARYPIHFHMKGDATGDEVRDVAIHRSYSRCVTIHGSDRVRLTGNVAYDALGHCYFMEDGAETGNVLTGNLGILTRIPEEGDRLLPSDDRPATFWVTNPANDLVGNVAAGSEGMGFWLAFPEHPTGLSRSPESDASVWPRRTFLGAFRDNVAHSNTLTGLHVDDGPLPDGTTEPAHHQAFTDPIPPPDGEGPSAGALVTRFERTTAYKNRERGIWLRGGDQVVSGAVLADNGIGSTFASIDATIEDALVVGETANVGSVVDADEPRGEGGRSLPHPDDPTYRIAGVEFYDGPITVSRVAFAGFHPTDARRASGFAFLRDNAFHLDPSSYAEAITWLDDSTRVYNEAARPRSTATRCGSSSTATAP
jgi:cell migration-inducing and hyaluronan-binding protein